jgi:hypothetical protein
MSGYIYLFQTKEFVVTNQPIYKFGKTTKLNHGALEEHPVGTRVIFQIICDDCHVLEKKINSLFTVNYVPKKRNERGYFRGNHNGMFEDMFMFYEYYEQTTLINAQIKEYQRNIVIEEVNVEEEVMIEEVMIEEVVIEEVMIEEVVIEEVMIEEVVIEEVKVEEVKVEEVKIEEEIKVEEVKIEEEIIEEIDVHTCCCSIKCFKGFTVYGCLMCSFSTTELLKMNKHLASEKNLFDSIPKKIDRNDLFHCGECDKRFKTQSGKWKHCRFTHTH